MQNNDVDNNVNLSVCAPEVGMLQPEALNQASLLIATPLLLSAGNNVNRGEKQYAHREKIVEIYQPCMHED